MRTNREQALNHIQAWAEDNCRRIRTEADHHPMNAHWKTEARQFRIVEAHIEHGDFELAIEVLQTLQATPPEVYTEEGKANFYKNMQWCIDLLEYPKCEFAGFGVPVNKA